MRMSVWLLQDMGEQPWRSKTELRAAHALYTGYLWMSHRRSAQLEELEEGKSTRTFLLKILWIIEGLSWSLFPYILHQYEIIYRVILTGYPASGIPLMCHRIPSHFKDLILLQLIEYLICKFACKDILLLMCIVELNFSPTLFCFVVVSSYGSHLPS